MRRSKICALRPEDVDGDVVHINKALVQNEKGEWVIKSTKTTESTGDIVITEEKAKRNAAEKFQNVLFSDGIS